MTLLVVVFFPAPSVQAVDLPPELPLWDKPPLDSVDLSGAKEQLRTRKTRPGSPSGSNRVFSAVSTPAYSIHRPKNPNGVGLVICPGGGFRDVWIDREGHDLAILLKKHNVTSLVLKYRTRPTDLSKPPNAWHKYQRAVQADGRQAVRILRKGAEEFGLQPDRIGICGFSAGGHLAISCSLLAEPERQEPEVSGMPDFAGLFYPGIPDGIDKAIESRRAPGATAPPICPMFLMNARVDKLTPADKCLDFYSALLKAEVNAELHVFGKGFHGFDLGTHAGKSAAMWPASFVAWLRDVGMMQD